jgi:transposase
LLRTSGRKVSEIARDLGVSEQTLRNWAKQSDVDEGRAHGPMSEDREELRRLRREVRVLREEREILEKAAAFFAKESDQGRQRRSGLSPRRRPSTP